MCLMTHSRRYVMIQRMSENRNKAAEELHAFVYGRVQGVGFRYFVVQQGRKLSLGGYARNDSDGSVEVLAQGPRPALEHLLTYLRQGPSAAQVRDIRVTWSKPTAHMSGFHVRW
jgi:acylphosphatase